MLLPGTPLHVRIVRSEFTVLYMSCPLVPFGSKIDSALSRTMDISLGDKGGRRAARTSGFSTMAPITLESRARRWALEAGN